MESFWATLSKGSQSLATHWASYTVLGSFFLYVLGYLALRFHLTALGLGTDLSVIDERYVFAGTKFLIFLIVCVPLLVSLLLLLLVLVYSTYRILPAFMRVKVAGFLNNQWQRITVWWLQSDRLAWLGIIFSLLMIEVMRQGFLVSNLLLAENLPDNPSWLSYLLLDQTFSPLYFSGLLAGTLFSICIFYALKDEQKQTTYSRFVQSLFGFLVCVQLFLIPVNYGIFVFDKSMPQVTGLERPGSLRQGEQAWLVWEGNEGKTFLLRKQQGASYKKSLISLPKEDVQSLEISEYNHIFQTLFGKPLENKNDNSSDERGEGQPNLVLSSNLPKIIGFINLETFPYDLRSLDFNNYCIQGNLWLSIIDNKLEAHKPEQISYDGNYCSLL